MIDYYQFGDNYDLNGRPEKVLVVASTGRSGSHYLCSLIENSHQYGAPFEYFHHNNFAYWKQKLGSDTASDTVHRLMKLRSSKQGWFSTKLHYNQLKLFNQVMARFDVTYIFIRRRDTISQAVSMLKASQDQNWIKQSDTRIKNPNYRFNYKLIRSLLREIHYDNANWQNYFCSNRLDHHEVIFEDLLKDPATEIEKINSKLGLNLTRDSMGVTRTEKQSNELNEAWVELYRKNDHSSLFDRQKVIEKYYRRLIRRFINA